MSRKGQQDSQQRGVGWIVSRGDQKSRQTDLGSQGTRIPTLNRWPGEESHWVLSPSSRFLVAGGIAAAHAEKLLVAATTAVGCDSDGAVRGIIFEEPNRILTGCSGVSEGSWS